MLCLRIGIFTFFCPGLVGLLVLSAGMQARGQHTGPVPPPQVMGTVTGRLFCSDTNGPTRLGNVILRSTTPSDQGYQMQKGLDALMSLGGGEKRKLTKEQDADQKRSSADLTRAANMIADQGKTATIALDGTYHFTNVPPGTYQIRGILNGYIDPMAEFSGEDLSSQDAETRKRVTAAMQTVTVNGNDDAHLERATSTPGWR